MKRILTIAGALLMALAGLSLAAPAQVLNTNPTYFAEYFWNQATSSFEPCLSTSPYQAFGSTPQAVVEASLNASLGQWVAAVACPGAGGGTVSPGPEGAVPFYDAAGTTSQLGPDPSFTTNGAGVVSMVHTNSSEYFIECGGSIGYGPLVENASSLIEVVNPCGTGILFFPEGALDAGSAVSMSTTDNDGVTGQPELEVSRFSNSSTLPNLAGLLIKPSYSTSLSLPGTAAGMEVDETAAPITVNAMIGMGGGIGYTGTGTVTVSGGQLASGSPPTCTTSLSMTGAVDLSCSGSGLYTVPPLVVISGYSGGMFANLSGWPSLPEGLSVAGGAYYDPAGYLHFSHVAQKAWTNLSQDFAGITPAGEGIFSDGINLLGTGGALLLNGFAGTAGQVATSQGPSAVPIWADGGGSSVSAPCPSGSASNAECYSFPNDATGTGINLLACLVGIGIHQQTMATCASGGSSNGTDQNPNILGVCVANCGTSGSGIVQTAGTVGWLCDGTISIVGNWVQPSNTVAGECHQPASGGFTPSPNEDPQGNTVLGRPVLANSGAGTLAQISWLPFGSYTVGAPLGVNGGNYYSNLAVLYNGGSVGSMAKNIFQAPSTDPIPYAIAVPGIAFEQSGSGKAVYLGNMSQGASGNDITFDPLSHGENSPPDEAMRFNGNQYQVPSNCGNLTPPCSASGTISLGGNLGNFDPGSSTGLYVLNLTANATTFTPITDDNFGHILMFVITPNSFTWTWPSGTPGFINAPVVSASSSPLVSEFFFDGTNYQCFVGCLVGTVGGVAGGSLSISSGTLAGNTCSSTATVSVNGLTTSGAYSRPHASYTGSASTLTGWGATGGMVLHIWETSANTATYELCNQTNTSIIYSAITFALGAD
jgi:hypothetical protein